MPDPVRPQSGSRERKIIRIKKRAAATSIGQDGERVRAGAGDSGEGGGSEEVMSEPGDVSLGGEDKPAVSSVTEESAAGASKRRKLSRTPLTVVQATPTLATPTMTSSQTTTASQIEHNETRHELTELTAAADGGGGGGTEANCEVGTGVNSRTDSETESVVRGDGVTGDVGDEVQREGQGQERRKISISEMKAEMCISVFCVCS